MKNIYLRILVQIYRNNLAQILHTAIRKSLKHARYKFRNSINYIKFRQITFTGSNKSRLIIINTSKFKSSIVIPKIMSKAV